MFEAKFSNIIVEGTYVTANVRLYDTEGPFDNPPGPGGRVTQYYNRVLIGEERITLKKGATAAEFISELKKKMGDKIKLDALKYKDTDIYADLGEGYADQGKNITPK